MSLDEWADVIKKSGKNYRDKRRQFSAELGPPDAVIAASSEAFETGLWRSASGVVSYLKRNDEFWDPHSLQFYSAEMVTKLFAVLSKAEPEEETE